MAPLAVAVAPVFAVAAPPMLASLVADLEPKFVHDSSIAASCPFFACSSDLRHSVRLMCCPVQLC